MTWFRRERIGRASIKESLDNLPSGICFADQSGLVILSNKQMYQLCYTLMGMDLQHISELLDALEKPQAGIRSVGADTNDYRFPEGKVWKFTQSSITDADGNAYTQVLAVDITALYEKGDELEQENRRLEEVNARARNLYAQLDNIVREEENFAVKTHVDIPPYPFHSIGPAGYPAAEDSDAPKLERTGTLCSIPFRMACCWPWHH